MVNHVRTLLMNRGRAGEALTGLLEEYIPESYVPRKLSPALQLYHDLLYGSRPDRFFLNMRTRQLMQVLHGSVLSYLVTYADTRITYDVNSRSVFDDYPTIAVQQVHGDAAPIPTFTGQFVGSPATGVFTQRWNVCVTSSTTATVRKYYDGPQMYEVAIVNNVVKIPHTNIVMEIYQPATDDEYAVTAYSGPPTDLASVINRTLLLATANTNAALFPLVTDKASSDNLLRSIIVNQRKEAVVRFAAVLLAIVARTAEQPQDQ